MTTKIIIISLILCAGLLFTWYIGLIPESFAPVIVIITFFTLLHILIVALANVWTALKGK